MTDSAARRRTASSLAERALAYPKLYSKAIRDRRRVRDSGQLGPKESLAFARSLGIGPTQADEEILWTLGLLGDEPPQTVVEIGSDEGGTLFLWTRAATDDALLVAVDIRPLGVLGRYSAWAYLRRGFARARQKLVLVMPVDSHAQSTVERLRAVLGGRQVDFLFIDGDHEYEGVRQDFEMYSPLVRPGGLVGFHDVVAVGAPGVVQFWDELKQTHETAERAASSGMQYGIGVVKMPSAR